MEAVIKVRARELNNRFLKKIKEFTSDNKNPDITIGINDPNETFFPNLDQSIEQLNDKDKLITFAIEEFHTYTPSKSKV